MDITETDEEIIISYKNGKHEVFKILINRYTSSLYNFIAHTVGKNDAPDIVQETLIKVWKNINKYNPEKASFKTWIFTIAKNSTTDFLRKKRSLLFFETNNNEETSSTIENIADDNLLPEEILIKLEDKKILMEALEKLRKEYQEILILHYQEEMTFEEIGLILNKPLNTTKSMHRRAILELRKFLS